MPNRLPLSPIIALIPAWNARDRLPSVIESLAGQVDGVVVIDNGSADGTVEWLDALVDSERGTTPESGSTTADLHVTLIRNLDNRGYAEAINQGIERALASGAAAVLLVNDDAIFQSGAVAALAAALVESSDVGATTAHLSYVDRPDVLNGAGGLWRPNRAQVGLRGSGEPDDGRYADAPGADYPSGAAALIKREAIDAVGGMDERYYLYYEDADWGLRARRAGWRTIYVPEAKVVHLGWAGTRSDPARRRYYNVRNRLLFAREHAPLIGRLWVSIATAYLLAKQIGRWWFPSRRRAAEAVLAGVVDNALRRYGRAAKEG